MNKYFLLLLIHFSFQLEVSAASILDKYFDSLPEFNIQNEVDLNYAFTRGQFRWLNTSKPVVQLTKVELLTNPINNEFLDWLPSQPTDLLSLLFSSSRTNSSMPTSEALASLNDPLSIIISHLDESKKVPKKIPSTPASLPVGFGLGLAGLLGDFALLSKRLRGKKSLPELINLETTNATTLHQIIQKEKTAYPPKPPVLKPFITS